jgi:hypothetical protein
LEKILNKLNSKGGYKMKLKEGFVLRKVAETWVVLSIGTTSVNFNGMLTLNNSGAMLFELLEKGSDRDALADALVNKYEVSKEQALVDVDAFYQKLVQAGCAE